MYSILDTGASAIYISSLWFDSFMDVLEEVAGTRLEPYEGRTYARCVNSFPPIFFQMGGHWVELAVKDYVIDVSRQQDGSICLIQVMRTNAPFNIYGMPLFVDYTTVFDDEASTVSFKPTSGGLKSAVEADDSQPSQNFLLYTAVEEFENMDVYASTVSNTFFFAFLIISAALWYLYYYPEWAVDDTYHERYSSFVYYNAFMGVCTLMFAFLLKGLLKQLIVGALTPDRIIVDVVQADEAIANVRAGHLGLLALLSYALHKLCCKKGEAVNKE